MTVATDKASVAADNFNSHAHVERDAIGKKMPELVKDFNSHAHVERDVQPRLFRYPHHHFNSHAHVERDTLLSGSKQ